MQKILPHILAQQTIIENIKNFYSHFQFQQNIYTFVKLWLYSIHIVETW
jgi:hypothetical protein